MFKKAVLKFSLIYSLLFFLFFWSFSAIFYVYLENSFGEPYIAKVKQRVEQENVNSTFSDPGLIIVTKTTEVTLEHLREALVIINCSLLILIPFASWALAKRTLSPIKEVHTKQEQFVSDASHELKTPLAIAAGEIDVALKSDRSKSYYIKTLINIKEEILRLSSLVLGLLSLTRSEDNPAVILTDKIDIIDLVNKAVASLSRAFKVNKIMLVFNFPEETGVVMGNQPMLMQLFTDLLENALKFSPSRTTVTVNIVKINQEMHISISDQGIGIDIMLQDKIFDRFYRADISRNMTKGYGLGLSIAKSIVKAHKGKILVESVPGRGAKFTVILPLSS